MVMGKRHDGVSKCIKSARKAYDGHDVKIISDYFLIS
jgi:hypothetical protein